MAGTGSGPCRCRVTVVKGSPRWVIRAGDSLHNVPPAPPEEGDGSSNTLAGAGSRSASQGPSATVPDRQDTTVLNGYRSSCARDAKGASPVTEPMVENTPNRMIVADAAIRIPTLENDCIPAHWPGITCIGHPYGTLANLQWIRADRD